MWSSEKMVRPTRALGYVSSFVGTLVLGFMTSCTVLRTAISGMGWCTLTMFPALGFDMGVQYADIFLFCYRCSLLWVLFPALGFDMRVQYADIFFALGVVPKCSLVLDLYKLLVATIIVYVLNMYDYVTLRWVKTKYDATHWLV